MCRGVYGVPKPMLSDIDRATFSNFNMARRVFWEDTIVPQLSFYEEALNAGLMPGLGDGTLRVGFDVSGVEALRETENDKAKRRIGVREGGDHDGGGGARRDGAGDGLGVRRAG